jgi:outer membrane protein assembly factor BamB
MRKRPGVVCVVLIAAAILLSSPALADSEAWWPQFRWPDGRGVANATSDPPVQFGPQEHVLWAIVIPPGHSSPCICGNRVFLTGFDGERQELQTFCLDRSSGNILWRRVAPATQIEKVHPINSPAAATPTTDGERLYVYFGSCGLLCYDLEGNLQWSVALPIPKVRFGSGTSPIVSGELVILSRDEQNDPYLLAVNRRTGEEIWKRPQPLAAGSALSAFGATSYSTPVVWGQEIVVHRMDEVVAYAQQDGARVWSVSAATNGVSTPVVGDDILFVGAWRNFGEADLRMKLADFATLLAQYDADGDAKINKQEFPGDLAISQRPETGDAFGSKLYLKTFFDLVDGDKDGSIDEGEWKRANALVSGLSKEHGLVAIKSGGRGDATVTNVLWQQTTNVPEVPSPLYYDGRVYMVKDGGVVSCMVAETGRLLYCERLGAAGPYYSSPIGAHGRVYIASSKGVMSILGTGDQLQILAKNDLQEPVFATPAVVENTLYVRTARHMYAFRQ